MRPSADDIGLVEKIVSEHGLSRGRIQDRAMRCK